MSFRDYYIKKLERFFNLNRYEKDIIKEGLYGFALKVGKETDFNKISAGYIITDNSTDKTLQLVQTFINYEILFITITNESGGTVRIVTTSPDLIVCEPDEGNDFFLDNGETLDLRILSDNRFTIV